MRQPSPSSTSWIDITGSKGARIEHNVLDGIGIRADHASELSAKGNLFVGVEQAFDVRGGTARVVDNRIHRGRSTSSVGYEKPASPPVPVFCPKCKSIFRSSYYVFASYRVYFKGNKDSCEKCGFEGAHLAEGLLDLSKEIIIALDAPGMTHAMIQALSTKAAEIISNEVPVETGLAEISNISPTIYAKISTLARNTPVWLWALMFLANFPVLSQNVDHVTGIDHFLWKWLDIQPDFIGSRILGESIDHPVGEPGSGGPKGEAPAESVPVNLAPEDPPEKPSTSVKDLRHGSPSSGPQ